MSTKNVLLVEDDAVQRDQVATILRNAGYVVLTAADGQEALRALRSSLVPDVILLDMLLQPVHFDGWSLLRYLKQDPQYQATPVLIVTGLGVANREWAASLGAAGVLRKPFEASVLLATVERLSSSPNSGSSPANQRLVENH